MSEQSRPTDLLHAHHLSRQIGQVHERLKVVEGFKDKTSTQLVRLEQLAKSNSLSTFQGVINETKQQLSQATEQKQMLEQTLSKLTKAVYDVQNQNKDLLQDLQKLHSADSIGADSALNNGPLLKRIIAIEDSQRQTDSKLDSMQRSLERFERSNESLKSMITEVMLEIKHPTPPKALETWKPRKPRTPVIMASDIPIPPTSSTESAIMRSSPPIDPMKAADSRKIVLNAGRKMIGERQTPRDNIRRRSSRRYHPYTRSSPTAALKDGDKHVKTVRPISLLTEVSKSHARKENECASRPSAQQQQGFVVVGTPHIIAHKSIEHVARHSATSFNIVGEPHIIANDQRPLLRKHNSGR